MRLPQVQLVAVQMTLVLTDYWTRGAFENKIRSQMDAVAAVTDPDLPTFVVFPEDVGLMLLLQGLEERLAGVRSIEEAIEAVVRTHAARLLRTRLVRWKRWLPALLLDRNRLIAETYFEVFSAAARDHRVHLIAGSAALPPYRIERGVVQWRRGPTRHHVHNTAYLFGPDGKVIGKQDKVELTELEGEAALNLEPGRLADLQVFDTAVGRVGIAICLDAFNDGVVGKLVELGAQVLVQPSANAGPWNTWQQEDWMRSSHQKVAMDGHFAYAVNPMLNGSLFDVAFYGQSAIVARGATEAVYGYLDLGPATGFIRLAASDRAEDVLVAVVPHPNYVA